MCSDELIRVSKGYDIFIDDTALLIVTHSNS